MEKKLRGLLINVKECKIEDLTTLDTLDDHYENLDCDCIDIVTRKIGGKYFDIICDDEGLLKENPIISGIDTKRKPMLVGNLFICKADNSNGELVSLEDKDIEYLKKHIYKVASFNQPNDYYVIGDLDY